MTTYRVNVGNREFVVDVNGNQVAVDGKPVQATLTALNNGGLVLLRNENRARELHVQAKSNSEYAVMVNGRHLVAQVEKNNGKCKKRTEAAVAGAINAPMPGMVVNVLVEEGQTVESGDPLVILESMKMQNELKSPKSGVISRVRVKQGDSVEQRQALLSVV